ncbi:MAG: Xaa-Pro peptidase family protein [Anaerolineae bacterium]
MSTRLEKLRNSMAEGELDAMLVTQPENRRYLSGFTGSAGTLVITPDQAILITDFRYYEQVARQAPEFELARIRTKLADLLPGLLQDLGVARLGFESQHLTVDQYRELTDATGDVEWQATKEMVERLRAVKEEDEVEALRRSAALTDAAFAHLLSVIQPGMTETQAAWEIEAYMRSHGASKVAFDLIVAAGPNGALPHARPGTHIIQEGEPIVCDIGCVIDGYCSDMTRTFCLGQPEAHYLEVWQIVLRAQEAAEAAIEPGMTAVEADALARRVIEQAGYGEQFGHGLGHGVGLAIHEKPRASRLSDEVLEADMSLTVEPGIYLPGEFGVRIEDLVMIRPGGVEVLSQSPKSPVLR